MKTMKEKMDAIKANLKVISDMKKAAQEKPEEFTDEKKAELEAKLEETIKLSEEEEKAEGEEATPPVESEEPNEEGAESDELHPEDEAKIKELKQEKLKRLGDNPFSPIKPNSF